MLKSIFNFVSLKPGYTFMNSSYIVSIINGQLSHCALRELQVFVFPPCVVKMSPGSCSTTFSDVSVYLQQQLFPHGFSWGGGHPLKSLVQELFRNTTTNSTKLIVYIYTYILSRALSVVLSTSLLERTFVLLVFFKYWFQFTIQFLFLFLKICGYRFYIYINISFSLSINKNKRSKKPLSYKQDIKF